ncbi:MAG: hypothetical protein II884_01850 [Synergistaceae bacterium]|nr:hypothetical protein [Synergistaceae bacterium]
MRKIFALLVIFLCTSNTTAFCAQSQIQTQNHDWVWNVLVVPPLSGWESEPGKSISTALSWCEREISESSNGIGGHDVKFTKINISGDADIMRTVRLNFDSHTIAIMSFALSPEADRILVARLSGHEIPLMIAGGENVLIDRGGRPAVNIFALDLYRDYRCAAFAEYAKRIYANDKEKRIALAASRFTVNQEREAKICYAMLDNAGFMPMPYWADASVHDTFRMMSEEIESYEGEKAGVVISFMGGMGAREIWRNFMRLRSSWRLWNVSEPDSTYLSCRGMIFADQNVLLDSLGGFIETKRLLWRTRAMRIDDNVAAGRAIALYEWLKRAVDIMPQPVDNMPRAELLRNLSRTQAIPFGNQVLNISPSLHRPYQRDVYIVEVRNREYSNLDVVNTRGLVYVPSY